MYEFLTSATTSLMTTINTHPEFTFLLKIIVLLMVFYKCEMLNRFIQTNHSPLSCLLKNLAVKDESSLKIISNDFFVHYQKSVTSMLELLISNSAKFKQPVAEWVFAVPLLHFMIKKCSKAYEQLEGMSWDHDNSTRQVN